MKSIKVLILLVFISTICAGQQLNVSWENNIGDRVTGLDYFENNYYASRDSTIFALDLNGYALWDIKLSDIIQTIKATEYGVLVGVSDGTVYVISSDGYVNSMFQINGSIIHSDALKVFPEGVLLGSNNGHVYFFDWDGALKWKFETGGYVISVEKWGKNFMIASDRKIFLIDENGIHILDTVVDGYIRSSSATKDHLAVASNTGVLWIYDDTLDTHLGYSIGETVGVVDFEGGFIASGDRSGSLNLIHLNGSRLFQINHSDSIVSLKIADQKIGVGTLENKVYIYDFEGKLEKKVSSKGSPLNLIIENSSLTVGSGNGIITHYRIPYYSKTDIRIFVASAIFFIFIALVVLIKSW